MKRAFQILISIAMAACLFAAAAIPALAAPMPAIVWDIATSTVMGDSDPTTFTGDVQIRAKDGSGNPVTLDLNGKAITINGNLNILGTLDVHNGSVTVTGGVTISGGTLKMTESTDATHGLVTVKGTFTTDGADHTGKLTAGTLDVHGDFIQYGNHSSKAFCPSGTFKAKLSGTEKTVWFETPGGSYLYNYTFATGTTFKSVSVMSLAINLAANETMTYPHLYLRGAMNGKTLAVPGGTVIAGMLTPGGGRLNVGGSLEVGPEGGITMTNAADYVYVNGSFVTKGQCLAQAGTLEINGNFSQLGVVSGFRDDSYVGQPAHLTKITGANRKILFNSPATSCFGKLEVASFTADSVVSLNCDLTADTTWAYPEVYYKGSMAGHNLTVNNNLYARGITLAGGTLTAKKNFTSAALDYLTMTNAADHVIVEGNFIANQSMGPACLTAGTVEILGSFSQSGAASSFVASGTHKTKLTGANKSVVFANPGTSWFNRLELAAGTTFATGSVLSMNGGLDADMELAVPLLYYGGNMGGHDLGVTGNMRLFGTVTPGGATIRATGIVALDGTLAMTDIADRLEVGGDFTGAGSANLAAGTVEFKKSFRYTGTSWQATGTNTTVLSGGADMTVTFSNPETCWFAAVTIADGTTLSASSNLSIKPSGLSDMAIAAPLLYLQGNLNGHDLGLTGNLTVPAGTTLTLGGGSLSVSGDMLLDNSTLVMTNAADAVTVGGNFIAKGPDHTGKLTEGRLTVRGDFTQLSTNSNKSYLASGNHVTALAGSVAQHVSFATPSAADGSRFAKLYSLNPAVIFDSLYYYSSYALTGAQLLDLSGTGGQLVPAFDPNVTDYIYVIPKASTEATITAHSEYQPPNAVMTMNGAQVNSVNVTGVPYDGSSTVTIVVTAIDGIDTQTYTVKVERLNVDLGSIGLSSGTLSPAFDADTLSYTVDLPANVEAVTLTPALSNPDTTFTINGAAQGSREFELKPGETVTATIQLTGQDGLTKRTYTVAMTRAPMITGLGQSAGTLSPAFSSPVDEYTLTLPANQPSVTLTPVQAAGCDTLSIDGVAQDSATFSLELGEQRAVPLVATSGDATFTYVVTIWRKPIISSFLQNPAGTTLTPVFDAEGGEFTLGIPASMNNITIRPQKVDCTRLTINGEVRDYVTYDSLNPLPVGESRELVIVAESGALTRTFTLTVLKGAIVSNLTMSQGTLTPAFDRILHAYTVHVPASSAAVSVTPTLVSGSVTVNGTAWNPASPVTVNPAPGSSATLTVVGTDGAATVTYVVTVVRDKPISAIGLSGTAALSPAFNAATGSYTVAVPASVASVTITPTVTADCTALAINDVVQNNITLSPGIGADAAAVIKATGPDGSTVTQYTVTVVRQGLLGDIRLSTGALSYTFEGDRTGYNVFLPNTTTSITITPVKTTSCGGFTINGANVSAIKLSPPSGGMAAAVIKAIGTTAGVEQTFTVRVFRIAPITGITVAGGTLSPAFSVTRSSYTIDIPAGTASVKLTPSVGYSCSTMLIDGLASTSVTLAPPIGGSASTTITAEAKDGSDFTYTVTVRRAALLRGITVTGGTLSPAYNVLTTNYTVSVPATTASVKITPSKASTGVYSMTINGKTATSVTLSPAVGSAATATVKLTSSTNRNVTQTYTVIVRRAAMITGISSTAGTMSPAAFSSATAAYTITLPVDTASTTLSYTKAATGVQSVTINGMAVTTYAVSVSKPGGSATATIVATATDGKTKSTYTVTVKRAGLLSGITAAGGTVSPAFSPATTAYTVTMPATAAKVTLTPVKSPGCTSVKIDGVELASKEFSPAIGGSVTATIVAKTDADTTATYTVTIKRSALVTGIRTNLTSSPVSPAFSATTLAYTVNLPATRSSVTLYATKAATGVKSLTIDGKAVTSLTVSTPVGGAISHVITATAADGITKVTYRVTVKRAGLLSGINASGSSVITPAFSTATKTYTVVIPANQSSVVITPVKTSSARTMKINNVTASSVTLSPAVGSAATAAIALLATDGVTKDNYTVIVRRAVPLTGISLSAGTLSPAFAPATQAYTVNLTAGTPVTITPVAATGASFTINGDSEADVVVTEPVGDDPVVVTIVATASNGVTKITYTVTVNWS